MTKRSAKATVSDEAEPKKATEATEAVSEASAEAPEAPEAPEEPAPTPGAGASQSALDTAETSLSDSKDPAQVSLQTPQVTEIKERQSEEEIQASIQAKLSNRDTSGDLGSEVNRQQLRNEVKQIADTMGFPLSRGTEAGAALLARARNRNAR